MNRTIVSVIGIKPFRIGGTEHWCRELSARLGERGWQNVLCFLEPPSDGVRQFLALPNVHFEVVPNSWKNDWGAAKALWRILRQYRPHIVHTQFTGFIGIYPWLTKLAGVKKFFFTDQASKPEGYLPSRAPFWKRIATRIINGPMDRVICISNYNLECLKTLDVLPAGRFCTIFNSIDLSSINHPGTDPAIFRRKYSIPSDRSIVLQVSWIIQEKGIEDLLRAAAIVLPQLPKAQFVFVGDGKQRTQYCDLAREMGISKNVTWTGMVENPLAEGVFDAADVVCQMSRWEEAFGWTIAEAMGASKPLVATRVGGIPELVDEGMSGFLVSRGDSDAMADRISLLLQDPSLRARFGAAGRQRAEEKFDLRKNVQEILRLYGISSLDCGTLE
jgi:glycosyltransferase involved in cell wall biosynthesis